MTAATHALAAEPAAAVAAPPAQLGLAGVPPPVYDLRIAIVGHLVHAAELRISSDGRAHIVALVHQAAAGLPFLAVHHDAWPVDRGELERRVAPMQRDSVVLVTGHGLQLATHLGDQVLRVLRCDLLKHVAEPGHFFAFDHHHAMEAPR